MRTKTLLFLTLASALAALVWVLLPALLPELELTARPAHYADKRESVEAPNSLVAITAILSLRELEDRLNQKLSQALSENTRKNRGKDIRIDIAQNGPLSLFGKGATLELVIPLSFKARDRVSTSGKITVISEIGLGIREDWSPWVDIHSRFKWNKKPYLKLGPLRFRIAGLVEGKIKDALKDMDRELRTRAGHSLDLKDKAEQGWLSLYEAHQLRAKPPVWLGVVPTGAFMAPVNADANNIRLAFALTAQLTTTIGEKPERLPPQPLPPLQQHLPEAKGFVLRLPVLFDYAGLAAQLKSRFLGKRIRLEQGAIIPTDFELYTSGRNLVMAVSFKGDAPGWWLDTRGTVYFTGEPVFDPQNHQLSIHNFQYTRQVNNPLVHTATWVLRDSLREQLERRMLWDLTPAIEKARDDSLHFLNRRLGQDIQMTGTLDGLNIDSLQLQSEGIVVGLVARGQLGLKFAVSTPELSQ